MLDALINAMVFGGAALMVYNIVGFVRFARMVKGQRSWKSGGGILHVPIALLVMFLLGYLAVGIFGDPDWIIAGILFFGSVFVFVMYRMLSSIIKRVMDNERLEAELMAAEQSNRIKVDFLSRISHEMRTPMNVIIGLSTLTLTEKEMPESVRTNMNKIERSAKHLLDLINSILDLNQTEAGELELENESFLLSDALDQVSDVAESLCERKSLSYTVELPEEKDFRCCGDQMKLKKVLLALLDNAVKFTDAPGSVTLRVTAGEVENGAARFTFEVRDTGIGMEPEFLKKAFDYFSQADESATSRYGGSGLGLSVAKQFTELMGGEIRARSEKNRGSVFTVTLPLQVVSQQPEEAPAPKALESLEGRRVLIVEDMPENAEIAADLLELEGVESEHAVNGQVGVDMFAESAIGYYDAILMDLRMPVMDGLTATRAIRELSRADAKAVPIIALTANAFDSDIRATLEVGMNAHLAKPADADLMYQTLKEQIGQRPDAERGNAT